MIDMTETIAPKSDQLNAETWLPVVGYEGSYEVSDQGRVRSLARLDSRGRRRAEKMLSERSGPSGHVSVALYRNASRADYPIHFLVLSTFVGPRPDGLECCHWNDQPSDNRLANLRWDSRSGNVADSVRNGNHHMAQRTECPKGHQYTSENTYLHPNGSRNCQECRRLYREERREERRAQGRSYMQRRRASQREA